MYVITFYSFKGGVGRTMALVNVAAELVRRGRTVLVVDFDLEAPGLETYKHLRPQKPHAGIVEYVTEFRRTYEVPDLFDFVYETEPIGKKGGRLWVMPAGRRDKAYRNALVDLDWKKLYGEEHGFLLFEDTKEGWKKELKPDYVLIDSRTGDTDVLGICTRQLPDTVVLMFAPNEQNLAGLEGVCRDIRREETEGLKKKIRLHFVAANVPDLDDEQRVLHRQLQAFRKRLDFENLSATIRRYESLNLLDQSVFTLDRPHTRLARTYRRFLRALLKDNLADRDGALYFLKDYPKRVEERTDQFGEAVDNSRNLLAFQERDGQKYAAVCDGQDNWLPNRPQLEDRTCLGKIANHFNSDIEILSKVADQFILEKGYAHAVSILDRILELDPNSAEALFTRARCSINLGQIDNAANDLLAFLRQLDSLRLAKRPVPFSPAGTTITGPGAFLYFSGIQGTCVELFCGIAAPAKLAKLAEMIENQEISFMAVFHLIAALCRREEGVPIAARLLRNEIARGSRVQPFLLLQARCWREVIQLQECGLPLALAHWGQDGAISQTVCKQALETIEISKNDNADLNQAWSRLECWVSGKPIEAFQALALLHWGAGDTPGALECLKPLEKDLRARAIALFSAGEDEETAFSWWQLREVSFKELLGDCQNLRRLFQGEPLRPPFLGPATAPGGGQPPARITKDA